MRDKVLLVKEKILFSIENSQAGRRRFDPDRPLQTNSVRCSLAESRFWPRLPKSAQNVPTAKVVGAVLGLLLLLFSLTSEVPASVIKRQFVVIYWNKFGYTDNSVTLNGTNYLAGSKLQVIRYGKTDSGEPYVVVQVKNGKEEAYPLRYFTGAYESSGRIITFDWDSEKGEVSETNNGSLLPFLMTLGLFIGLLTLIGRHRRRERNAARVVNPAPRRRLHNLPRGF